MTRRRGGKRQVRRSPRPLRPPRLETRLRRLVERFLAPQPLVRLEAARILIPLCILGFLSSRLLHVDHWLGDAGFQVPDMGLGLLFSHLLHADLADAAVRLPDLGPDYRQPIMLPAIPGAWAWAFAALTVTSGLSLAAGFLTRYAAAAFAFTLVWSALADRLAAFTVSKLGAVLVIALLFSPCGARYGIDAWRRRRRRPKEPRPTRVTAGYVRFFQLAPVALYLGSGICKGRQDWLAVPDVLWTHLHDSYQTWLAYLLAAYLPAAAWGLMQGAVLLFEAGAPLWFGLRGTRPLALVFGLGMHLMIGLMFGPVIWFSLLMMSLLVCGYLPSRWLRRALELPARIVPRPAARRS
jgi:uncharacterized membrane protein YphA (DoxX/SURF4 family)